MQKRNPDLVTVLEVSDTFALALAKSSLEHAAIDYLVTGDDPRYFSGYPGAFGASGIGETPLCGCLCSIQVAREWESQARAVLEVLENPPAAADVDVESEQN